MDDDDVDGDQETSRFELVFPLFDPQALYLRSTHVYDDEDEKHGVASGRRREAAAAAAAASPFS